MEKVKRGNSYYPLGTKVEKEGHLLDNDYIYVPDKYTGQTCKIDREDVSHYKCHFSDGWVMWIPKVSIKLHWEILNKKVWYRLPKDEKKVIEENGRRIYMRVYKD